MMCLLLKALGVDTEDDIYLLSNYFLNRLQGPGDGEQEGSEKGAKDEEMEEEKGGAEETTGGMDEGEKKDDEGSVVLSVDEKASESSSVKAHLSGNKVVIWSSLLCSRYLGCHATSSLFGSSRKASRFPFL